MVSEKKLAKRKLKEEQRASETPEERKLRKAAKRARLEAKTRSDSASSPPRVPEAAPEPKAAAPEPEAAPEAPGTFEAFAALHAVSVTGEARPPMTTFEAAPFFGACKRALAAQGFSAPTPTQAVSWPLALEGRDLISVAKTGSGKTLGFLLPAFHLVAQRHAPAGGREPAPKVAVLAPTRELASQIAEDAHKFAGSFGARVACCYGGAPKWQQVQELRKLNSRGLVVATPGRLNDLLAQRKLGVHALEILVLDEADRMLDMGFEPQIRSIVALCPAQRQTMLFTATWDRKVQKVAGSLLTQPGETTRIAFGGADSGRLAANKDVTQTLEIVPPRDKRPRALAFIKALPPTAKSIVFTATKRGADDLANELWGEGLACDAIHGDKEQRQRTWVIGEFKASRITCLVATDVAARGLDISDVTHVINVDFPGGKGKEGIEDYVHRIGRTGRAGRKGEAHSFLTKEDAVTHGRTLVAILRDACQHVPPELEQLAASRPPRGGGKGKGGRGRGRGGGGRGGRYSGVPMSFGRGKKW